MDSFPEILEIDESKYPLDINCCENPFFRETICAYKYECKNCRKMYKLEEKEYYDCDECELKKQSFYSKLYLMKDNKTNWTKCKKCNKEVEYYIDRTYNLVFEPLKKDGEIVSISFEDLNIFNT